MSKAGCISQKNPDGSDNPKYVDLLEEDKALSGQKFVCVSFVSPENILKQRNHFFFLRVKRKNTPLSSCALLCIQKQFLCFFLRFFIILFPYEHIWVSAWLAG